MMNAIQKHLLQEVAGIHEVPQGAYSLRVNGSLSGKQDMAAEERRVQGDIEALPVPIPAAEGAAGRGHSGRRGMVAQLVSFIDIGVPVHEQSSSGFAWRQSGFFQAPVAGAAAERDSEGGRRIQAGVMGGSGLGSV